MHNLKQRPECLSARKPRSDARRRCAAAHSCFKVNRSGGTHGFGSRLTGVRTVPNHAVSSEKSKSPRRSPFVFALECAASSCHTAGTRPAAAVARTLHVRLRSRAAQEERISWLYFAVNCSERSPDLRHFQCEMTEYPLRSTHKNRGRVRGWPLDTPRAALCISPPRRGSPNDPNPMRKPE